MSEHYIEFENVTKSYGTGSAQVHALDGVSFGIEKGEFCILLGSSGAGKTTLLNMLGGKIIFSVGKTYHCHRLFGRNGITAKLSRDFHIFQSSKIRNQVIELKDKAHLMAAVFNELPLAEMGDVFAVK